MKSNSYEKCVTSNFKFLIILIVFIHDALFIGIMVTLGNNIFEVVHRVMVGTRRNFVFLVSVVVTFLISLLSTFMYILYPPFSAICYLSPLMDSKQWERTHGHFKQLKRKFMQY